MSQENRAPYVHKIMGDGRGLSKYKLIKDIGSGNFGTARLMQCTIDGSLVAIKYMERGDKIDKNVEREIINHRTLQHPSIVRFHEVFVTTTHLGIVMEYCAGGELFERIVKAGRFSEDEARYFFQQLICGVDYCHRSGVCHRDLKLENTLLDGGAAPRLKICDFGYSKSALDSQPKSTVGTPAYIAPEVLQRKEYSGQTADVWSCGVTLFVMLVGAYPFEDTADPRNFRKTIQRIMAVKYAFPPGLPISPGCLDLISRIFVANPQQRITMQQIREHPWFQINLPAELADASVRTHYPEPYQTVDEVLELVNVARNLKPGQQQQGTAEGDGAAQPHTQPQPPPMRPSATGSPQGGHAPALASEEAAAMQRRQAAQLQQQQQQQKQHQPQAQQQQVQQHEPAMAAAAAGRSEAGNGAGGKQSKMDKMLGFLRAKK